MPLFAPRGCIEPDAPDPTGLRLFAGHTDTTAALRWFAGQTGRLFADPAAGLRSGGIKPPRSPRTRHPAPCIRYSGCRVALLVRRSYQTMNRGDEFARTHR